MKSRHSAFTIIELLIVISVIAILSAMFLSIINMLQNHAKVAKTKSILDAALLGISSTAMTSGTNLSNVPHPMANTMVAGAMARSLFLRGVTTGSLVQGTSVDTTAEALECATPAIVATSEDVRLLLPTDVYVGNQTLVLHSNSTTDDPLIYGLDRQHLNILGSGWGLVDYRRLPGLSPLYDPNNTGILQGAPYTNTGVPPYPDTSFLVSNPGDLTEPTQNLYEIDSKKVMDFALGPEVSTELSSLGGLRTADITNTASIPIANYRLRLWPIKTGSSFPSFDPRNSKMVGQVLDNSVWKPYLLRGVAIYDAWGHEVLFYTSTNGSMSFMSAGLDGYFCWNPGPDLNFDTMPGSTSPSGDDLDASHDNVYAGAK